MAGKKLGARLREVVNLGLSHRKGELLLFSEPSGEKESGSKTESGLRGQDGGELSCYREGRRIEEVVRMGREEPSR